MEGIAVQRLGGQHCRMPMKVSVQKFSRRRFLLLAGLASPALVGADAKWIEPQWVKVRSIKLAKEKPSHRLVHI